MEISDYFSLSSGNFLPLRSYSLWLVLTFVSSAALLRALRLKKRFNWLLYAVTLALGFYTHFFSVIVALGQGIYIFIIEKFQFKRLRSYLLSISISVLLFAPWLAATLTNLGRVDEAGGYYSQFKIGMKEFFIAYYKNIGVFFIDFYHNKGRTEQLLQLLLFTLIVYSLYFLVRQTPLKVWLFVVIMIILTPLLHGIVNILSPSAVHIQSRYFLPSFLAIQLSLSFLLAFQISSRLIPLWQQRIWQGIFIIVLTLGIISSAIISTSPTAAIDDQKGTASGQNVQLSTYLNASSNPLVITETSHSFILALLYQIKDDITCQLLKPDDVQNWQNSIDLNNDRKKYNDIFLLYPTKQLLEMIEKDFQQQVTLNKLKGNLYQIQFNQ